MAAEQIALARLVSTDWAALCPSSHYCFPCGSPVCGHCCGRHAHQATHHPQGVYPLKVERVHGRLAIDSTMARGCGYNTANIQRITDGSNHYILLLTVDRHDRRGLDHCQFCLFRIKRHSRFCSMQCRLNGTPPGGAGRAAAQRLVDLAAQGQFGAPLLAKDRFCFVCRTAFSSASCPGPLHGHDGAPANSIKTIIRFEGWAAVPDGQLPAHMVQNVQVLQPPGGPVAYPIQRVEAQVPLDLGLGVGVGHQCERPGCQEILLGPQAFCCMRCRDQPAA